MPAQSCNSEPTVFTSINMNSNANTPSLNSHQMQLAMDWYRGLSRCGSAWIMLSLAKYGRKRLGQNPNCLVASDLPPGGRAPGVLDGRTEYLMGQLTLLFLFPLRESYGGHTTPNDSYISFHYVSNWLCKLSILTMLGLCMQFLLSIFQSSRFPVQLSSPVMHLCFQTYNPSHAFASLSYISPPTLF